MQDANNALLKCNNFVEREFVNRSFVEISAKSAAVFQNDMLLWNAFIDVEAEVVLKSGTQLTLKSVIDLRQFILDCEIRTYQRQVIISESRMSKVKETAKAIKNNEFIVLTKECRDIQPKLLEKSST